MRKIWNWLTRPSLARFNRVVEASAIAEYERLKGLEEKGLDLNG